MKELKSLEDIKKAKETVDTNFGTLYNYWIEYLFDCYIAKLDGDERIAAFLSEFTPDARALIQKDLDEKIEEEE